MLPRLIHFIFGMAPQPGAGEFTLHHWLAIRSAATVHPRHKVVLWHAHAPQGPNPYWEAALRIAEGVTVQAPDSIFGAQLHMHAHKADVLRLQVLLAHGGIYLDADSLVLETFDRLHVTNTAMGMEVHPGSGRPEGLCNAVILSRPNASFLHRWLETYEFFHSRGMDNAYAFHGCRMPLILSRQRGDDIAVLPRELFFRHSWDDAGMRALFEEDLPMAGSLSIHLWEHMARARLAALTPEDILRRDTTYNRAARRFIEEAGPDAPWRQAVSPPVPGSP